MFVGFISHDCLGLGQDVRNFNYYFYSHFSFEGSTIATNGYRIVVGVGFGVNYCMIIVAAAVTNIQNSKHLFKCCFNNCFYF